MEDKVQDIILKCFSLDHPIAKPARNYLSKRGFEPEAITSLCKNVCFHEKLGYWENRLLKEHYPAIVILCREIHNASAPIDGVMTIYLTSEGEKAPEDPCKKAQGLMRGRSCVIGNLSDEVLIGEGFETTLAACVSTGLSGIAAMTSGNLEDFQFPEGTKIVRILVDKDKSQTGQDASNALARKCLDQGLKVYLHYPPSEIPENKKGIDWADEMFVHGCDFVRQAIFREEPYVPLNSDPNLVTLAEVESEEVDWLIYPYIPRKKVTFLEGDPGLGKSFITLNLTSAISKGKTLQNGLSFSQGKVVLFCTEDGLGDTVRPRLEKMEADLTQITAYKIPIILDDEGKIAIENALRTQRPELMILDPLSAFLSADSDMNRANHARQFMSWLAEAANRFNAAILIIRHLTKGGKDQAIYRGLGSIDFTAAARSVLMVAANPNDRTQRAIFHTKSNLAPAGDPVGYRVSDGSVEWTGKAEFKLEDFLDQKVTKTKSSPTALQETAEALKSFLEDGPKSQQEVADYIEQEVGTSGRTLARAKRLLGVESFKEPGSGREAPWLWRLPAKAHFTDFTEPWSSDFDSETDDFDS